MPDLNGRHGRLTISAMPRAMATRSLGIITIVMVFRREHADSRRTGKAG